jgi:predicted RNase H-like HicB family nuclease
MTNLTFTAIYENAEEGGYIGYVAELPGANTQGETLAETRENLKEAVSMLLECYREEAENRFAKNRNAIKEDLVLQAA